MGKWNDRQHTGDPISPLKPGGPWVCIVKRVIKLIAFKIRKHKDKIRKYKALVIATGQVKGCVWPTSGQMEGWQSGSQLVDS